MAYDSFLADRVQNVLQNKAGHFVAKKMMGGLTFMVNDKMCIGIVGEKLMCRVGVDEYENALNKVHCSEMAFTGRPMKGYVFVDQQGIISEDDLMYWVDLCLAFNPLAKSSKKK